MDLKPCPFCGFEANLESGAYRTTRKIIERHWLGYAEIRCTNPQCAVKMERRSLMEKRANAETMRDVYIQALTDLWNTRKVPPK